MPSASLDVGPAGRVGVVWTSAHEDDSRDTYFAESADRGLSYGTNVRVNPDLSGLQQEPAIAYDVYGVIHVLWEDSSPPDYDYDIHYASSTDSGCTFSDPVRVNDDPLAVFYPQNHVAACGDPVAGVAAVWLDGRENFDENVYLAGSIPVGVPEDEVWPNDPAGEAPHPDLTASVYPNPTPGGAYFRATAVRLFDIRGRLVREIISEGGGAGGWLYWDGRDERGVSVPSGIYLARFAADGVAGSQKVAVLR